MTSTALRTPSLPADEPGIRRRRNGAAVLAELDREWARLSRRRSTVAILRAWDATGQVALPRPVRTLDELVAATQPSGSFGQTAERTLRDLVALAPTDDVAGRVVLQRLLPGLISGASRWRTWGSEVDPIDVVIGAAWIAIRRFDMENRHAAVAPSLISDALWGAFRRDARRTAHPQPAAQETFDHRAAPAMRVDPVVALAAAIRAAADAGVPAEDLALVRTIARAQGPSAAARELGVTARTVRNRRDAATHRIRSALGPDWADWSHPLTAVA